jgi:RHS repeat-associated protein
MALYPGTAALKPRVHPGNQDNLSRTHSGCLYWYRSRHYDATRGRFGQADKWHKSVLNPVGYHAFGYVNGNPVLWVDPMGYVLSLSSVAATSFTGIENISSAIIYAINKTQKENSKVLEKVDIFSVTMALYFYKIYTNELQKVLTNDISYSVIIESQNVLNKRYDDKHWLKTLISNKTYEPNGYFDASTNTISISSYYTTENAPDPYDYVKVLIHEAGHAALKQMSLIYNDLNMIEFSFVDSIAERLSEYAVDYLENCGGSNNK